MSARLRRTRLSLTSLLALTPVMITCWQISKPRGVGLSASGLAISDSELWMGCAYSLGKTGLFPDNAASWCGRRPIYSLLTGTLFKLIDSADIVLILWSVLIGIALFFTIQEMFRSVGVVAFLFPFYFFVVWSRYGSVQFMSETGGFLFVLLSCLFLFRLLRTHLFSDLFLFGLSILLWQQTRPSSTLILLLPIVLYFYYFKRSFTPLIVTTVMLFSLSLLYSQVLRETSAKIFDAKDIIWVSIYGLATGNRPWNAYSEIDGFRSATSELEAWSAVKKASLEIIFNDPLQLIGPMLENGEILITGEFLINPYTRSLYLLLVFISFIRLFQCLKTRRNFDGILAFITSVVSTLLSYMIFLKTDGNRTILSTSAIFVSAAALTLFIHKSNSEEKYGQLNKSWLAIVTTASVAGTLTLLSSVILPSQTFPDEALSYENCVSLVKHKSREDFSTFSKPSGALDMGRYKSEDALMASKTFLILSVSNVRLANQISPTKTAWWNDAIQSRESGFYFQALARSESSIDFKTFYSQQPLPETPFCISYNPHAQRQLDILNIVEVSIFPQLNS